jgi:hypothetical protein
MPEVTGRDRRGQEDGLRAADLHSPAERLGRARDVLNQLADLLSDLTPLLKAAGDLPSDAAKRHITEALAHLADAVQSARDHVSAEHSPEAEASLARSPLGMPSRLKWSEDRAALMRERLVQTVRALQRSAADNAARLERLSHAEEPSLTDYRTETKRWRAFTDQAEQIAKRLEQDQ